MSNDVFFYDLCYPIINVLSLHGQLEKQLLNGVSKHFSRTWSAHLNAFLLKFKNFKFLSLNLATNAFV